MTATVLPKQHAVCNTLTEHVLFIESQISGAMILTISVGWGFFLPAFLPAFGLSNYAAFSLH